MRTRRSPKFSGPLAAVEIALFLLVWILFAPARAGGQAEYVVVSGNSMFPLYQRGDLIVLRHVSQAQVGDIFAYSYPQIGTVIHRIVARDGDTYVFKGDNNGWRDGYQPVFHEMIGKAWIHIPRVGAVAIWLRKPWILALFTATIGGVMMVTATSKPKRKKTKLKTRLLSGWWDLIGTRREGTLLILTLLFFASGILAFFAFTHAARQNESTDIAYTHSLDFGYMAAANSEVYGRATLNSGDPIFPSLTCRIYFELDYALAMDRPLEVNGSYRVLAQVSEYNGWVRTIELQPATEFPGGAFSERANLDICQVQTLISRVEELTGLQRTNYTVSILVPIDLQGSVGAQPYRESITPRLDFGLDGTELYVLRDPTSDLDPLNWNQKGLLTATVLTDASLPILGYPMPIWLARVLSLLGLAVCITGFVLIGMPLYGPGSERDLRSLRFKYGTLLVKIQDGAPARTKAASVIDMNSMDDLVRLAEHMGLPVFEQTVGDEVHFTVVLDKSTYRYAVPDTLADTPDSPGPATPEEVAPPPERQP